jgi:hypothetical protein
MVVSVPDLPSPSREQLAVNDPNVLGPLWGLLARVGIAQASDAEGWHTTGTQNLLILAPGAAPDDVDSRA